MHYLVGNLGHLSLITSFVSALIGSILFLLSSKTEESELETPARIFQWTSFAGILGTGIALFAIIQQGYYEYFYAWSHSSRYLDAKYLVACFWEGQEGSFLLWLFWNSILLFVVIRLKDKQVRNAALGYGLLVQAFLASMILGVDVAGLKVGSSPFILMRDAMPEAPVFAMNPDYVPKDGKGLNPLLQNYWMVIHPPTLFLGFGLTVIPFALAMGALHTKRLTSWFVLGRKWTIVGVAILGLGIMMGAYWAYETLNFGGYWNWDPVENAVYVPWLVLAAALHGMKVRQAVRSQLGAVYLLVIGTFILILYSTFLTRSGILGETSVHSFTDLGLSGQLLLFLLGFIALSILQIVRNRTILFPKKKNPEEDRFLAQIGWLQIGVVVLLLASFQVLVTTSIPVYNAIGKLVGLGGKLAPPASPIAHYTSWQMAFFALILLLTVVGQAFWYRLEKTERKNLFINTGIAGLLGGVTFLLVTSFDHWSYPVFFGAATASFVGNVFFLLRLSKQPGAKLGSSLAHTGLAIMLIGVLFSAGYSKVISINRSGLVYRKEFSTEMNRDNVLLWRGKSQQMDRFKVAYTSPMLELKSGALAPLDSLFILPNNEHRALTTGHIISPTGDTLSHRGDTLDIKPENTYFEVVYTDTASKKSFALYPRAQVNPSMGLLASPDIRTGLLCDLYTHVSSIPPTDQEPEWSVPDTQWVAAGDTFFVGDYVARLDYARPIQTLPTMPNERFDAGVELGLRVFGPEDRVFLSRPKFIIKGGEVGRLPGQINQLALRFTLENIDPEHGRFLIATQGRQQDWIIMKASEKPLISLVWGGFMVMMIGFGLALYDKKKKAAQAPNKEKSKWLARAG